MARRQSFERDQRNGSRVVHGGMLPGGRTCVRQNAEMGGMYPQGAGDI